MSKVPIKIRDTDLVGDCVRLNRRFELDEDRISSLESPAPAASTSTSVSLAGLHSARITKYDPATLIGVLFFETDRGNVGYQSRYVTNSPAWVYVSGVMAGTLTPDQRPTDLGTGDTGFLFNSTDTYQQYRWSGLSWVENTQANSLQIAYATASLTLTATPTDVVGATITLSRAGRYLVHGIFDFVGLGAGDVGVSLVGGLVADGVGQAQGVLFWVTAVNARVATGQQWAYSPAAVGKVVKLRASKTAGTGASIANTVQTSITALWVGP